MKDVNAATEFLTKYTEALILAACMQALNMESLTDEVTAVPESFHCGEAERADRLLSMVVDSFALPEDINFDVGNDKFQCHFCGKFYKKLATLRKHMSKAHPDLQVHKSKPTCTSKEDHVRNYSINALALCLLARNYEDARKHGDGLRIIRLIKFMMLLFKIDGKTKYSFHTLHHLAQVTFLLPPKLAHDIIWKRFVNNKGRVDTNVEMDRGLEHHNRAFKLDCRGFMGKVTEMSITRSNCSYQEVEKILSHQDTIGGVKRMSGIHAHPDFDKDVKELAEELHHANIFGEVQGRYHKAFPTSPKNVIQTLDTMKLKQWLIDTINSFKGLNIYSQEPW